VFEVRDNFMRRIGLFLGIWLGLAIVLAIFLTCYWSFAELVILVVFDKRKFDSILFIDLFRRYFATSLFGVGMTEEFFNINIQCAGLPSKSWFFFPIPIMALMGGMIMNETGKPMMHIIGTPSRLLRKDPAGRLRFGEEINRTVMELLHGNPFPVPHYWRSLFFNTMACFVFIVMIFLVGLLVMIFFITLLGFFLGDYAFNVIHEFRTNIGI
jgi:hypothetical protein